jgi:hypothetical protein
VSVAKQLQNCTNKSRGQHQHALLNIASFHYETGGLESAKSASLPISYLHTNGLHDQAIDEAIRVARSEGDSACLRLCMRCVYHLSIHNIPDVVIVYIIVSRPRHPPPILLLQRLLASRPSPSHRLIYPKRRPRWTNCGAYRQLWITVKPYLQLLAGCIKHWLATNRQKRGSINGIPS